MVVCDRLRELRERKNLSQGDIEKRTGLFRCYRSQSPTMRPLFTSNAANSEVVPFRT